MKGRIATLFVAGTLAGANAHADEGGLWVGLAPMSLARQEVGAARIGDEVYVVGGLLAGFPTTATDAVEVYDVAADQWSFVAPLPVPLDHMAVASCGGKLYVMGGYSGDFVPRAELWIYDPAADQWSPGSPLPEARGACWAVELGGRIHLFGGDGPAGTSSSTFVYDPGADQWSSGADMPTPREHLTAAVDGGFVYVVGGRDASLAVVAANERYHPATDQWDVRAPMPTARSAMATAAFGGRIYVAGGEFPLLHDVNEVYCPSTDTWTCQEPMPLPRHGIAAVALDDRILTPAGGTVQGLGPTTAVDSFLPAGLLGQPGTISLSAGGTQTFDIFGGPAFAGDVYQLIGSLSGTSPGFTFAGVAVPLNPDAYLLYTVQNPGGPPLSGSFGMLDASGAATALLTAPPGSNPSLAGTTAHHAFGVFDVATSTLVFASNPQPLVLVP